MQNPDEFSVEDSTGEQITSRGCAGTGLWSAEMESESVGLYPGRWLRGGECGTRSWWGWGCATAGCSRRGPAAPNAAPSPSNDGVPQPPGAVQVAAGSLVWVAAESAHGKRYGEQIDGVSAELVRHGKTVHFIGDGKTIFCVCIGPDDVEEFNNRPSLCDGRVVSRKQNALGSPEITLSRQFPRRCSLRWVGSSLDLELQNGA